MDEQPTSDEELRTQAETAGARAPHLLPDDGAPGALSREITPPRNAPKRWIPKRVLVTRSAAEWPLSSRIIERAEQLGVEIIPLKNDRLIDLKGTTAQETYVRAKSTLAIVVAPPSHRKLQPIPPSADWQFHLARGCPAHCQYCYLAGSLDGPPVTRVYANLPDILENLRAYLGSGQITSHSEARMGEGTTFEASCYTDPLALEHLTGAVADAVRFFGAWDAPVQLRWTTKFDEVEHLLQLPHQGKTRARFSVNALEITRRFEGGTASLAQRVAALAKLAQAGYPVGLTVAPIMPIPNWREAYTQLFTLVRESLIDCTAPDLTVELITHRFTPGSKDVLTAWYPATKLEMNEATRSQKRTKFGSLKYVYTRPVMHELRTFFYETIQALLPQAKILYWT